MLGFIAAIAVALASLIGIAVVLTAEMMVRRALATFERGEQAERLSP